MREIEEEWERYIDTEGRDGEREKGKRQGENKGVHRREMVAGRWGIGTQREEKQKEHRERPGGGAEKGG